MRIMEPTFKLRTQKETCGRIFATLSAQWTRNKLKVTKRPPEDPETKRTCFLSQI